MKGGDDVEFEQIYIAYFKDVYLYLRSLSANEDIAEELTQEVFSKALKSLSSFDGTKDIRAWLFAIARNTYFTFCKRQKRYAAQELFENMPDQTVQFTQLLEDQEQAFQIHRFLHEMKDPYKEVFTLRVFGELPFEKIALLFGKSSGWARVTYHRARKQIIDFMEGLEHE